VTLRFAASVGAVLLSLVAGAPALDGQRGGPVEKGPGSLASARKYLEGRWSLTAFDVFPPDRDAVRIDGAGTLTYDAFGNLDVEIRVDAPTARMLEDAGIRSAGGRISTRGRTIVDMQARTLTYVLEGQPAFGEASGPLALNRPRHWRVEGSVLTLTTKDDAGRPLAVARWEKVP
jgi:hypothetical protein